MTVASLPLIDLLYRRGHLHFGDSRVTAVYFFWFSLSLAFWAAQGLYARAFYAAGNTWTPMLASTIITLASLPLYSVLFRSFSTLGLVIASDLGITANCIAMAVLLDRRRLVSVSGLQWKEVGKSLVVALAAAALSIHVGKMVPLQGSRRADIESLALTAITWLGAVALGLWVLRSKLPQDLRRRRKSGSELSPPATPA
jgi:putative peptidoglycan lipid II flippase